MRSLALVTAISLAATAALAQTPTTPTTGTSSGQAAQSNQSNQPNQSKQGEVNQQAARQQVRKNLQQEGFSDIKIVPRSFLVTAKDKQGNQVMMFITPNSVTAVTKIPETNATTGQGSSANQGSQSSQPQSSASGK